MHRPGREPTARLTQGASDKRQPLLLSLGNGMELNPRVSELPNCQELAAQFRGHVCKCPRGLSHRPALDPRKASVLTCVFTSGYPLPPSVRPLWVDTQMFP